MPELIEIDEPLAAKAINDALIKATEILVDGSVQFRARADTLVIRHAILGLVPDWRLAHRPVKRFEAWDNGKQRWFVRRETRSIIGQNADGSDCIEVTNIEVEGWSARLQRPVAGAYRKARLEPDPVPVMVARAEYEIFCAAMRMLLERLKGRLASIELMPVDWPVQPWGDSPERTTDSRRSRILPDISAPLTAEIEPETIRKSETKARRRRARKAA